MRGIFALGRRSSATGNRPWAAMPETSAKATCDLSCSIRTEGTTCYIPFNPTALVENLRCEQYLGLSPDRVWEEEQANVMRSAYYRLRPHLGVTVRKQLQRLWFRGRTKITFPSWPLDRTSDQILEKLLFLAMKAHRVERIPFIWFWPNGHKSCVILTHDVEESAGVDFCPSLMDIDDSFGIKSSFHFIPEERYAVSRALLERVRERGLRSTFTTSIMRPSIRQPGRIPSPRPEDQPIRGGVRCAWLPGRSALSSARLVRCV